MNVATDRGPTGAERDNGSPAVPREAPPATPRQLPLPLPAQASSAAADFVADASNAAARAWLARPAEWPSGRLVLCGPAGSGKTHLLRAAAAAGGWSMPPVASLHGLPAIPADGIALDDADQAPDPRALLHLLNACAEQGVPVLLAARTPPTRWAAPLPDLASRLRATTVATIAPPTEALLAALLQKHLADRQIRIEPTVQQWLLRHLPRDAAAVANAVDRIDRMALAAARTPGLVLVRAAVADLLSHDGSMADAADASRDGDPLL